MKILTILGIFASIGLLFGPAAVLGGGPPGGLDVNVVNPDTLQVEVVNDVLSVEGVPKQPFNKDIPMRTILDNSTDFFVDIEGFEVPEGMQLVVETVTMVLRTDSGADAEFRFICNWGGSPNSATHFLGETFRGLPVFAGTSIDTLRATANINCRIPSGGIGNCWAKATDEASGGCWVSGYLVPE